MRFIAFTIFLILAFCIISLIGIQTQFYSLIFHSDNLYLPLFVKDLFSKENLYWFFPPSTYFFPDLFLMILIYPFVSLTNLPIIYGLVNFSLIFVTMRLYLKQSLGVKKSNFVIFCILFIYLLSVFLSFLIDSKLNLFGFLFTNGHHTSVIFIFFYVYSRRNEVFAKFNFHKALLFFVLVMSYLSDRFIFIPLISILFVPSQTKHRKYILYFVTLVVFLGEILHQSLSLFLFLPDSLSSFLSFLSARSMIENLLLVFFYIFTLFKLYLQKVMIFFHILFFGIFVFLLLQRNSSKQKSFLVVFGFFSLVFTILVGRFVYPHPFPIRYLVPFLFIVFVWSIQRIIQIQNFSDTFFKITYSFFSLLILYFVLITVSLGIPMIEEKRTYRESLIEYLNHFGSGRFWTGYESEKKIRFWSQTSLRPLPCDSNGKAYPWITGAFSNELEVISRCPGKGEKIWTPNSLTKDF